MSSHFDYKIKIGLSLLLIFKFYFYTRGYFFSNFNTANLLIQCIVLLIVNLLIVLCCFRALSFFQKNYFLYNLSLSVLASLLTVYTIKTFFYFANIISFKEFLLNYVVVNLNLSNSIKVILVFIFPYLLFFSLFVFLNKKENYLKFLSIFGYLFLINMIYSVGLNLYFQYNKFEIDKFEPYTTTKKNYNSDRKVIWVIFDDFDPKYAFHEKKVKLKNFEKLKKNSIYFSKSMAPADSTLVSMTANLVGTHIKGITTINSTIELITPKEKFIKFNKENTIFGRLEENNLQYQIYSSALDYCSLLNVKNCKAIKYEFHLNHFSNKWYSGIGLTYPVLSQLKLFFSIISKDKNNDEKLKRNFSFSELNLDKYDNQLKKIKDIDGFGISNFDIFNKFLKSDSSLLFVHLYLPHEPADYIKQKLSLITNGGTEDYYLNLLYSDYVLSRIIDDINDNYQKI